MHRFFQYLLIFIIFLNIGSADINAQDNSLDKYDFKKFDATDTSASNTKAVIDQVRAMFDEMLDYQIGMAALQVRHISNVGYGIDNAIGLNRKMRDTIEVLRDIIRSEIFIKSLIQYDHFWTNSINRNNYSPKENELERNVGELYSRNVKFEIRFIPAWDTTLDADVDKALKTEAGLSYTCQISVQGKGVFTAEISQSEMETALNEAVKSIHPTNDIFFN